MESPLWKIVRRGDYTIDELKYEWATHPLVQQLCLPKHIMEEMLSKFDALQKESGIQMLSLDFSRYGAWNWYEFENLLADIVGPWYNAEIRENKRWISFLRCWCIRDFEVSYRLNDFGKMLEIDNYINGNTQFYDDFDTEYRVECVTKQILEWLFASSHIDYTESRGIFTFSSDAFDRFAMTLKWFFDEKHRKRPSCRQFSYRIDGPFCSVSSSGRKGVENGTYVTTSTFKE